MRQSQSAMQISPSSINSHERRPTVSNFQSYQSHGVGLPTNNSASTPNVFDHHHHELQIYNTQNEVLALAKAYETPNLIAMATAKNLQLLKASSNDIILEQDLSTKLSGNRSSKFGIISDLSFGHQQYGRHLAASTMNGSIHVYNLDRGTRVKTTLMDHQRAVNTLDFNSTNGYMMLSGSQDGKIKIWDLRMNNTRATLSLNGNADAVRATQFNPKRANILASVFDSGVIEKWDIRKPNSWERRINAHNGPALSLDWHPELDYIVTGGRDKQLQVWNLGAGQETREPSHVIYTSGPILKAKWCRGSGNRSIMNTDIATCFLNDDPCIQIWNLSRKYVPKHVIECHSNQITQLLWRTPKHLISSSKDKSLIQQDITKAPNTVDSLSPIAVAWDPKGSCSVSFVKQERSQFELTHAPSGSQSQMKRMNSTAESTRSESPSFGQPPAFTSLYPTNSSSSFNTHRMNSVASNGSHSSIMQPRRPQLNRNGSRSLTNVCAPLILQNRIDLKESDAKSFEYLSNNYLMEIPEGSNILEVCELNANEALKVGYNREYLTWLTIKTAIEFDIEHKLNEIIPDEINQSIDEVMDDEDNESGFDKMESNSRLGTSFGSMMSNQMNEEAVIDDVEPISNTTNEANQTINEDTAHSISQEESKDDESTNDANVSESKSDMEDIKTQPIKIKRNQRYSFASSMDFDDERSPRPFMSYTPSPRKIRQMSSTMMEARASFLNMISKSVETRESRSQLTEIMRNGSYFSQISKPMAKLKDVKPKQPPLSPWDPSIIIKGVLDYESNEGNILMCAMIALLFRKLYPKSMTSEQAEEWVLLFHEQLSRCGLFNSAAVIVKVASKSYNSLKQLGQTQTSARIFCCNCHTPILNEQSKERFVAGVAHSRFGFWYCDRCCQRQASCVLCEEPITGNAICVPHCRHMGHFKCLSQWFLEENQLECPGC